MPSPALASRWRSSCITTSPSSSVKLRTRDSRTTDMRCAVDERDAVVLEALGTRGQVARRCGRLLRQHAFDHHDPTFDAVARGLDTHARAAQSVENVGQATLPGRERRQRQLVPRLRIERQRHADHVSRAVDDGQALEQVVDLILAHLELQALAVHVPVAFEVPDAIAVQHHALERERRLRRRARPRRSPTRREGQRHTTSERSTRPLHSNRSPAVTASKIADAPLPVAIAKCPSPPMKNMSHG